MPRLVIYKGLPASGKTTQARKLIHSAPTNSWKRVNKDDLRAMIDNGVHSKGNEELVLRVRDYMVGLFLSEGKNVISDDTNLNPRHEADLRKIAKNYAAQVSIIDLTLIPIEECIKRDKGRPNYVGEKVIRTQYNRWLKPAQPEVEVYPVDPNLPWCVICDIDGTIAKNVTGRSWFCKDGEVEKDKPREVVIEALNGVAGDEPVFFLTGRFGTPANEEATTKWIRHHAIRLFRTGPDRLFMRPPDDTRADHIIKREMFDKHIRGRYNVYAIFDDRPQVIKNLWIPLGLGDRLFNVGDYREDF